MEPAPADETSVAPLPAAEAAAVNWVRNLTALGQAQPRLADDVRERPAPAEWVYGRDGALTALDADGQWWAGCSVPMAAARAMLKTLEAKGSVACQLQPMHAAHIAGALERLRPEQAVIAVTPDADWLRVALGAHDFSGDVRAGRLWFAWGEAWEERFSELLREHEGLPVPQLFVRTAELSEEASVGMIGAAQRLIGAESARRSDVAARLAAEWAGEGQPPCVVAPSAFRLWEDDGETLAQVAGPGWRRLDPDHPAEASAVALARAAAGSGALVTINAGRADLPQVLPTALPVVTWVTTPRIPAYAATSPDDRLLVADAAWGALAVRQGWPAAHVAVAIRPGGAELPPAPRPRVVGLIGDTSSVAAPPRKLEYSSHQLLWDLIAGELAEDPWRLGGDVDGYLAGRMRRLEIGAEGFDRALFIDRLIVPAFQQGVARAVVGAGLPARLYGRGWAEVPALAGSAAGAVTTRGELTAAATACAALVHAWPVGGAHAVDAAGRPVVRAFGRARSAVVREIRGLLDGAQVSTGSMSPAAAVLSAGTIEAVLPHRRGAGGV